jgi:PIN domain nuclease of toxin-antitoxin system
MDLLVDTCTALWYWSGDPRLSATAEEAIREWTIISSDVAFPAYGVNIL